METKCVTFVISFGGYVVALDYGGAKFIWHLSRTSHMQPIYFI